ncbi:MAG: cytochrome c peroxidase [Thermodesulfovibrionales bacterium]
MKMIKIMMICLLIVGLASAVAFAGALEDKGKALFNDAKFAGGSKACSSCHKDGKGLENAADKKEFKLGGKTQKSIEEAINVCIVGMNKGKAIDVKSEDMKALAAYVKSFKKGKAEVKPEVKPEAKPAAKKPAAGY